MVNLCCFVWWEDEKVEWPRLGTNDYFACQNLYEYVSRKTCKSLVNELDYALIWNPGKWVTLTMSGPSPHKIISIYLQEEEKNEIEEEDDEKSMKYLPPPYNPNLPQPTNVQIPIPPPLPAPVTQAQGAVRGGPYKVLIKELEQLKKDIKNFPFKDKPLQAFPLREVPNGVDGQEQARISFVHEPLKASELRAFKKEMKSMIEDPIG
ncbi:uncharacterized protein LOC120305084 [Crotalus tigris]|uniref:uncharacterized protein LOC120305084 n=1 Tax=Crotalus tigris TaxID=88082 RepID=UPI00192F6107|nr:uncharacterized protein LOC120305084 [Crotalus tigris]XP_039192379.1 uncharacterized protein LOC120305084 [Crotalus tigris]